MTSLKGSLTSMGFTNSYLKFSSSRISTTIVTAIQKIRGTILSKMKVRCLLKKRSSAGLDRFAQQTAEIKSGGIENKIKSYVGDGISLPVIQPDQQADQGRFEIASQQDGQPPLMK